MPDTASQNPEPSLLTRLYVSCCQKPPSYDQADMSQYFEDEFTEYEYIVENMYIHKIPKQLLNLVPVHAPISRDQQQKKDDKMTPETSSVLKVEHYENHIKPTRKSDPVAVYFSNVYKESVKLDGDTVPESNKPDDLQPITVRETYSKQEKNIPSEIQKVINDLKTKNDSKKNREIESKHCKLKRNHSAVTLSKETSCDFTDYLQDLVSSQPPVHGKLEITDIFPKCEDNIQKLLDHTPDVEKNPSSEISESLEDVSVDSKVEEKVINNIQIRKKFEQSPDKKDLRWKIIINKHSKNPKK